LHTSIDHNGAGYDSARKLLRPQEKLEREKKTHLFTQRRISADTTVSVIIDRVAGAIIIIIIIIIIIVYFRHKVHRNYNKTAQRTDRKYTQKGISNTESERP